MEGRNVSLNYPLPSRERGKYHTPLSLFLSFSLPSLQTSGMWHFGPATTADRSGWQKPCDLKSQDTLCNPSLIFNSCQRRHLGWRSSLFWDFAFFYRSICNIWNCHFCQQGNASLVLSNHLLKKEHFLQCMSNEDLLTTELWYHLLDVVIILGLSALIYYPFTRSFYVATHKQYPVCTTR